MQNFYFDIKKKLKDFLSIRQHKLSYTRPKIKEKSENANDTDYKMITRAEL